MEDFTNELFVYVYIASAFALTWYKPFIYTLQAPEKEYHQWITYWLLLSLILVIEQSLFTDLSDNLGYFFLRTLAFFFLSEQKFAGMHFQGPNEYLARIFSDLGNEKNIKVLCGKMKVDEELTNTRNLHPWAPTPNTVNALAMCRIGEIASLDKMADSDQEYLIKNGLDDIVMFLDDPEDAKSINAVLCLFFLSEQMVLRNHLVCMNIMPRLKRFMDLKNKPLMQTALSLCKNIYQLNEALQQEFIKLEYSKSLISCLKESDPLAVLEAFSNIFSLISV